MTTTNGDIFGNDCELRVLSLDEIEAVSGGKKANVIAEAKEIAHLVAGTAAAGLGVLLTIGAAMGGGSSGGDGFHCAHCL